MSAAKDRPSRRAGPRKRQIAATTEPALILTPDEVSLLHAYRMLNNMAQDMIGSLASLYVKDFPRYPRPALRLVVGGAA